MKRSLVVSAVFALLVAVFTTSVVLAEEAKSPQALEISNNLNCPVCEGQSVRDSNSQLARDMRRTVQEMLNDGKSEDEVYEYFTDRYGVGILRNPPKSGFFLTLWWAPVIGIAVGVLILGTFVTQRRREAGRSNRASQPGDTPSVSADDAEDLSEYEERILRDLDDTERRGR